MLVKMARQSGQPVYSDQLQKCMNEWQKYYDLILGKYKHDMKIVREKTDKLQDILNRRFDTIIDVELPESQEQWLELQKKFYGYGVMVTMDPEETEVRLILLDRGI